MEVNISQERAKKFFKIIIFLLIVALVITILIKTINHNSSLYEDEESINKAYFSYINSDLSIGDKDSLFNSDVERLQRFLNSLGYKIKIDGIFGPETEAALKEFQEDYNIYPADGVLGPRTREVINKILRENL